MTVANQFGDDAEDVKKEIQGEYEVESEVSDEEVKATPSATGCLDP